MYSPKSARIKADCVSLTPFKRFRMKPAEYYKNEKDSKIDSWKLQRTPVCKECMYKEEKIGKKNPYVTFTKIPFRSLSLHEMMVKLLLQSNSKVNFIAECPNG